MARSPSKRKRSSPQAEASPSHTTSTSSSTPARSSSGDYRAAGVYGTSKPPTCPGSTAPPPQRPSRRCARSDNATNGPPNSRENPLPADDVHLPSCTARGLAAKFEGDLGPAGLPAVERLVRLQRRRHAFLLRQD